MTCERCSATVSLGRCVGTDANPGFDVARLRVLGQQRSGGLLVGRAQARLMVGSASGEAGGMGVRSSTVLSRAYRMAGMFPKKIRGAREEVPKQLQID